jgi:hypothetical protein
MMGMIAHTILKVERENYKLLYRVALDVMPIQATSVPCERAFSSSKETSTARRNRLSPELMEWLQMLKYAFRNERLNPMRELFVLEQDLIEQQHDFEPEYIDELVASGRLTELLSIIEGRPLTQ